MSDGLMRRFHPTAAGRSVSPVGPWRPAVWIQGPESLVVQAKSDLWASRNAIEHGALMTSSKAMAGTVQADANEQEILIDQTSPGRNTAAEWLDTVKTLHATAPLYGKAAGEGRIDEGTANPNA
jgi:hypothetical protein